MQMTSPASATDPGSTGVIVRHRVPGFSERWVLPEVRVPEAAWHDDAAEIVRRTLERWVRRTARDAAVYRCIAVRMQKERPQVGFDPDVCVVEPAPPDPRGIDSIRIWEPGHSVPRFALEVVSKNHPYKDYAEVPDQCAAAGVEELVVFDPARAGPRAQGQRRLLSVWRRDEDGSFERLVAGDGPAWSRYLEAWLVPSDGGSLLRIADDASGRGRWPTVEEAALADKEAALRRVAELEAELRRR